ncbi:MAG: PAS domain-containing protein [Rhodobacterales bacterium]
MFNIKNLFNFKKTKSGQAFSSLAEDYMGVIDRYQATIQFELDGTIRTANKNFLEALGYSLDEIVGKHHSMFVYKRFSQSKEYEDMWRDLSAGKSFSSQFPRVTKDGSVVWIQATYAPCLDKNENVESVIKIATNVTQRREGIQAIAKALAQLRDGNLAYRLQLRRHLSISPLSFPK